MPIWDFFSSREAEAQGGGDVGTFDHVPDHLHVQVSNIIREALGTTDEYDRDNNARPTVPGTSTRRWPTSSIDGLGQHDRATAHEQVHSCLSHDHEHEVVARRGRALLLLDRESAGPIALFTTGSSRTSRSPPAEAVEELNERFRRAGFG